MMLRMSRRAVLAGAAASAALPLLPTDCRAAGDTRLVMVNLVGGLDLLSALPPIGDPDFGRVRAPLLERPARARAELIPMSEMFALHPSLSFFHECYRR